MIQFMLLMEDIKLFLKGSQSFYSIDSCCDALVGHLQQLQTIDQNDFRSIIQFLDHLFIRQLELSDEIITIMLSIVTNCFKFGDRMNVNCPLSMLIRKLVQSDFFTLSFSTPTTSQNFTNLLYELIQYHNLFLLDSYPSYSILSNIQLTSGLIPSFISILSTSKVGVVQLEELRGLYCQYI
ncbi:hypothetical protein BC833DRAFT_573263 [Globomyces pollinis-pini]|nr:hypothetical protein BC833DRAFT_573263 [Globomyces pollinis-pini]